jgi:hypothetical protein
MPANANNAARSNRVESRPGVAMNSWSLFVLELILIGRSRCLMLPESWQELQKISSGDT